MPTKPLSPTKRLEELARGLTDARRKALLLLDGEWWAGPQMPDELLDGALTIFRAKGLAEREFRDEGPPRYAVGNQAISVRLSACWHFRLTPLGLAVRAYLKDKPDD